MLSKECRAHKAAKEEAMCVINDLREELKQVRGPIHIQCQHM